MEQLKAIAGNENSEDVGKLDIDCGVSNDTNNINSEHDKTELDDRGSNVDKKNVNINSDDNNSDVGDSDGDTLHAAI